MKRTIIFVTICTLTAFGFLYGKTQDTISLHVKDLGDDTHQIDAYLKMQAPEEMMWKIISEYEQTPTFVSSIKTSKVLKREKDKVLLDMHGGGWFVVNIDVHLLLDITEIVDRKKIDYTETSGDEFSTFKGFWEVTKEGEKSIIHLSLVEKPKRSYFGLTRMIIKSSITGLFESMEKKVQKDLKELAIQAPKKP